MRECTNLEVIGREGMHLSYDIDENKLDRLYVLLFKCLRSNLSEEGSNTLTLRDSVISAELSGVYTSLYGVLNSETNPEAKVAKQIYYSISFLFTENRFDLEIMNIAWNTIMNYSGVNKKGFREKWECASNNGKVSHLYANPSQIPELMDNMLRHSFDDCVLRGIIYSFYILYVHPYHDGNCRLSRAVLKYFIGVSSLPIEKAISETYYAYVESLHASEMIVGDTMDITPYINYMIDVIAHACCEYLQFTSDLTENEQTVLNAASELGWISLSRAEIDLGETALDTLNDLVDKGYLYGDSLAHFILLKR